VSHPVVGDRVQLERPRRLEIAEEDLAGVIDEFVRVGQSVSDG